MAVEISESERRLIEGARTASLATRSPEGFPRLVPICFALTGQRDDLGRLLLYTPLDQKPKRSADPHDLARVRDLLILPEVTLLVEHWEEDWTQLAWARMYGTAELLEPEPHEVEEHLAAIATLREKYPQYRDMALEGRPVIRVAIRRVVSWSATPADPGL
jgi:PPOX class probable F420-dependent enzyme